MTPGQNTRVLLASRPEGAPTVANFRIENGPLPQPEDGQLLLRTVYLSLDPYMRSRMSAAKSYAAAMNEGDVMVGATVCRVEASRHPDYQAGEWGAGLYGVAKPCALRRGRSAQAERDGQAFACARRAGNDGLHRLHGPAGDRAAQDRRDGRRRGGDRRGRFCRRADRETQGLPRRRHRWRRRRNAATRSRSSASMPVWITAAPNSPLSWRLPARRASTCISRTWAEPSSTRCCLCSTPARGCRCAA